MKTLILMCAAALALCAQTTVDTVNVHFSTPVMVGQTLMPAGNCAIQIQRSSNIVLVLRSAEGPVVSVVVNRIFDETTDSVNNPHVVLRRSGDVLHFERLLLADRTGFQVLSAAE